MIGVSYQFLPRQTKNNNSFAVAQLVLMLSRLMSLSHACSR